MGNEAGSAIVISMLVMTLLLLLGMGLLAMSETEGRIAANDQWAEAAFQAAEAAVQEGIDRLDIGSTDQIVEVTQLGDVTFRSGGREDTEPQPPAFVGSSPGAGYAVGTGTGYNSSGYVFSIYALSGTGRGPRNTEREVEIRAEIGPIPQ